MLCKDWIKRTAVFFVSLILMLASAAVPSQALERITDFHSRILINEDSSLSVTETIKVRVENIDIKRGIIRHFPIRYKNAQGRNFTVGFNVTGASLDGRATPFTISEEGAYANVRLGDPNRIIPPGLHTFVINYKTIYQVGFFDEFDELYWNVTGNGWSWPIQHASCAVSLPAKYSGEKFRSVEWYTGSYGEKGDPADAKRTGENRVETTRSLARGEGLTVVYTWKKGLVSQPPSPFGNELAQHIIAAAAFILSCVWSFFSAGKLKKETAPAIIPRFYPPRDASPAFVRSVKDSIFDSISFSSNLIDLAVKGMIKIEEKESGGIFGLGKSKTFFLRREKKDESAAELTRDEKTILSMLFPGGAEDEEFSVDKYHGKEIARANNAVRGEISIMSHGLTRDNLGLLFTGALIILAGAAAVLPFTGQSWDISAAAALLGCGVILLSVIRKVKPADTFSAKARGVAASVLPAALAAFIAFVMYGESSGPLMTVMPFIGAGAAIAALRPLSVRRTKHGSELHSEIEGLYMYITAAEKERMEMFNAPDDTPEVYERLLPYAVAMGAAKTWGDRFAKVLEKANYNPEWYDGPAPVFMFTRGDFLGSFANSVSSSITAGMPKPEFSPTISSGSGGGGFSGGGGGGGGGSGW